MKIAIDLTSLADNFSGIERYAMNIARELIEMDSRERHTYILLFKRKIHSGFKQYQGKKNVVFKVWKGQNTVSGRTLFCFWHFKVQFCSGIKESIIRFMI